LQESGKVCNVRRKTPHELQELCSSKRTAVREKTENTLCENAKRQEHQVQYAHVQAGRSYTQAVSSINEQAQDTLDDGTISQMLLKIMAKLDQQESLNRTILKRVTKLENESKRRAITNRQNQWGECYEC
jgi:hypothetical protein